MFDRLTSEVSLSILIAILSIMTAFASYQSAAIDSTSGDNRATAMSILADSNYDSMWELSSLQDDLFFLNQAVLYADIDPEFADIAFENMTEGAQLAFGSEDEEALNTFFAESFSGSNDKWDEAQARLASAAEDSNRATAYQLTVMIMAVGVSFAAWASLAEEKGLSRRVFTLLSILCLIIGTIQMLSIPPNLVVIG